MQVTTAFTLDKLLMCLLHFHLPNCIRMCVSVCVCVCESVCVSPAYEPVGECLLTLQHRRLACMSCSEIQLQKADPLAACWPHVADQRAHGTFTSFRMGCAEP